jgi:teichuronic acid biosynthesis glycosyltransferase TuaC
VSGPRLELVSVCRHLPQPDNPGAGVFVLRRLAAMAAQADVHVIQPIPHAPLLRPLPSWARQPSHLVDDIRIQHAPMFYVPGILKSLDGLWLARSITSMVAEQRRRHQRLILDAHFGYPDGVGCVRVARRLRLPVFVTVRGMEIVAAGSPAIRRQMIRALNQATGCISVSRTLLDRLSALGLRREHTAVIPNAVDRSIFRPGDRQAARATLRIAPAARVIVSVGNLIAGKGHHHTLQAMAALRHSHANLLLIIIGGADYEPEYPQRLRRLVDELGLQDCVRMAGTMAPTDVARHLQAADVFALATAREGCCNAILEALAVGCPVVSTRAGDNADYVSAARNGTLVPVGDGAALTAAIAEVLARGWDSQQISAELAIGSWERTAGAVLDFMHRQCALRAPAGGDDR